jgi:hypothetical protein
MNEGNGLGCFDVPLSLSLHSDVYYFPSAPLVGRSLKGVVIVFTGNKRPLPLGFVLQSFPLIRNNRNTRITRC